TGGERAIMTRSVIPGGGKRAPNGQGPDEAAELRKREARAAGRTRIWQRVGLLVFATFAACGAGIAWPVIARGPEFFQANWQNWWFLGLLLLVPFIFWRGTFGEDRRTPRLRVGTLSALSIGPTGWRVWVRDMPGVFRSVGLGLLVLALAR